MHLVCMAPQRIILGHRQFEFAQGETLHTENSQKYTVDSFRALAQASGYSPQTLWSDPERLFSVHWLKSTN